jgi:hypothetical protein
MHLNPSSLKLFILKIPKCNFKVFKKMKIYVHIGNDVHNSMKNLNLKYIILWARQKRQNLTTC